MALNPALSEVDGGPIQYAASIWAGLHTAFKRNASRPAVICLHQRPNHLAALVGKSSPTPKYLTWTFDQLLRGGVVIAAAWQDAGIKTGDTVITFIPNGADHCVLRMAAIIGKLNFTALDLGMTTPARIAELQHMLTLLKPAVVVVANNAAAQAVDAASKVVGVSPLLSLTANWDGEVDKDSLWQDLDEFGSSEALKQERHDALLEEALTDDHDRVSAILFTSGTSMGAPKGCPKTVLNAIHTLNIAPQRLPGVWTVRLVDTANFRAICNAVSLTTWADDGTFIVSGGSPTPAGMIQAIAETKVTDIFLLPAIVRLIADHPDYSVEKMKTVTTIGIGGDVVTRSMLALSEEVFPNVKAFNVHGSSEGSKLFDWAYCDPVQPYFGEVPSIGKVWPGVRVKAVNTEGSVVPRGTPGELHISSSAMIPHYLEGVSQASFYNDGQRQWFNAGDMVVIDKNGFIYITGRTKDIIKRIGVPITPGVIETCLAAYTGAVVTVIDVPHAEYGAEPYAIMSTFGGKTIEQLKARVVEMLGKDYALGGAVPLSELGLEAWPLNATDKVNKIELKAALKSRLGTM